VAPGVGASAPGLWRSLGRMAGGLAEGVTTSLLLLEPLLWMVAASEPALRPMRSPGPAAAAKAAVANEEETAGGCCS